MGKLRIWAVIVLQALALLWTGGLWAFDWFARAKLTDDMTGGLLSDALHWLFSTPWYVPAGISVLLTLGVMILALRGAKPPAIGSSPSFGKPQQLAPVVFQDQELSVTDLITEEQRITNKTFINCAINGPAILWLVRSSLVRPFTFFGDGIEVAAPGKFAPAGAVIVKVLCFHKLSL